MKAITETNDQKQQAEEAAPNAAPAPFVAPKTKADFPQGQTKIEHEYENGNKVVFLLLSNESVAKIREGLGEDCERASMESNGDRTAYMSSLMSAVLTVDEKKVNMFDLKKYKAKDYLNIQASFADLNF